MNEYNALTPESLTGGLGVFNHLYAMPIARVDQFSKWLLTESWFSQDQVNLIFNNASDYVVGVRVYPFDVTTIAPTDTQDSKIRLGKIEMDVYGKRFLTLHSPFMIDFGTIRIPFTYNDIVHRYLCRRPYTKLELYLPYMRSIELDNSRVIGKDIHLQYAIDFFTGEALAFVSVVEDGGDEVVINTVEGTIGNEISIGGGGANQIARNMIPLLMSLVSSTAQGAMHGGKSGAIIGALSAAVSGAPSAFSYDITPVGANSPYVSTYAPQTPYVIVAQPKLVEPEYYAKQYGRPLNETRVLGGLSGYTEVTSIHLEGLTIATSDEITEVERLLKSGVIL